MVNCMLACCILYLKLIYFALIAIAVGFAISDGFFPYPTAFPILDWFDGKIWLLDDAIRGKNPYQI